MALTLIVTVSLKRRLNRLEESNRFPSKTKTNFALHVNFWSLVPEHGKLWGSLLYLSLLESLGLLVTWPCAILKVLDGARSRISFAA